MGVVEAFFETHKLVLFFVYGQIYFLMGFAVLLKNVSDSEFRLSQDLKYFALFAITHGLADWGEVFLPLQQQSLSEAQYLILFSFGYILLAASYIFLLVFGLRVVYSHKFKWPVDVIVSVVVVAFWVVSALIVYPQHADYAHWMKANSAFIRYFIGLPAGLVSAYAFWDQAVEFDRLGKENLTRAMRMGAVFLGLYGILTGSIVPKAAFFPASVVNYESFIHFFGIPVQVFRLLAGIGIGINIVRSMELFDVEQRRRVEDAEKGEAILKERERISREIHDGTIQSLYGIGLRLEFAQSLAEQSGNKKVQEHLDYSVEKLAETISNIRAYIMNLRYLHFRDTSLRKDLQELVQDFRVTSNTLPEFIYREEAIPELTALQRSNLYYIVREALNNIRKHARATEVKLEVNVRQREIRIVVADNGRGFEPDAGSRWGKHGLDSIEARVKELNGQVSFDSAVGEGTRIEVTIPRGVRGSEQNKSNGRR